MSQSPQGWYEDDDAPGLARWWDGDRWTEHTMALPTPQGAGEVDGDEDDLGYFALPSDDLEPLPPRTGPTRFPRPGEDELPPAAAPRVDPTLVGALEAGSFGELEDSDNPFFAPEPAIEPGLYRPDWLGADVPARHRAPSSVGAGDRFADRFRRWPLWARVAAPVLAVALMAGLAVAAAGSTGSGNGSSSNTTVATFAVPSSTTTAVTFVPLGPSSSAVVDSTTTVVPSSTTSTTARRSTATTAAPTTTTTAAPTTTTTAATTTTSTSTTSTTAP